MTRWPGQGTEGDLGGLCRNSQGTWCGSEGVGQRSGETQHTSLVVSQGGHLGRGSPG